MLLNYDDKLAAERKEKSDFGTDQLSSCPQFGTFASKKLVLNHINCS